MDLFKDKTFEEMDEITQMIEPFESKINVELSQFPDEFEIDNNVLDSLVQQNRSYVRYSISYDLRKIIERKAYSLGLTFLADTSRTNYEFVDEFFAIESSEDATYNATTNELVGEIKIIKKKIGYEDKDIESNMKSIVSSSFGIFYHPSDVSKPRINEILDLFNVKEGLASKKAMQKVRLLRQHYVKMIDDRSLNIKDVELFKRFMSWNVKYIRDGNLPALANITKVKIMMRKGLPIYSIKEDIT